MFFPKMPQNIFTLLLLATNTALDTLGTRYLDDAVGRGQMVFAIPTHEFVAYTSLIFFPPTGP